VARSALAGSRSRGRDGQRAVLAILVAAGAVLRFATLGVQSIWYDEAATAHLMRMGFAGMLRGVPHTESTPPLFYVLEWIWTRPFGTGAVGLRSMSAVIGTLTIPLIYFAARRLLASAGAVTAGRTALAAAALAAFNPLFIWYSQEARSYALLVALIALGLWAVPDAAEGRFRGQVLWALASVLALATHYFAAFLVAPELVWLLWHSPRRRALLGACASIVVAGVALTPLALHQQARGGTNFIADSSLLTRLVEIPKQLFAGYGAPGEIPLTIVAAVAVATGFVLAWRASPPTRPSTADPRGVAWGLVALSAVGLAVPLLLAFAGTDYVITRNVIGIGVPLTVVVAWGVTQSKLGACALVVLCAVGVATSVGVALNVRFQRDDWRDAAAVVPPGKTVALVVMPGSGAVPMHYYLPGVATFGAPVAVSEVDVISIAPRPPGKEASTPMVPSVLPTLPGFAPAQVERHTTFVVLRFLPTTAAATVTVTVAQLLSTVVVGSTYAVLLNH
jgi:mannosyltransferase